MGGPASRGGNDREEERVERVGVWLRGAEARESLGRRLAEARALECWPNLVGPHLAKRTRVMQLAGDQLIVVAHGSALRQELTFQRDVILQKFNEAAGRRVARRILFLESDAQLSSLVEASPGGPVEAQSRESP